jgi:hypothetical protein
LRAEHLGVECDTDEEHVEYHAELRDGVEHRARSVGKDRVLDLRCEVSEHGRPEKDASHHLGHHLRLPDAT